MSTPGGIEFAVVIYRPRLGNYHHWGLHLHSRRAGTDVIFQAEGEPHELSFNTVRTDPRSSARLIKRIVIGHCPDSAFRRAAAIIGGIEMQNDVSTWDCREYVIDTMDALEEAGILGSLPKYDAVKDAVKNMRGSIDSTHRAVVGYEYDRLPDGSDEEAEQCSESPAETDRNDSDDQPRNIRSEETVQDSSDENDSSD